MAFQGIINRKGVDWAKIRQKYPVGIKLECKVAVHLPFGIFLDIGDEEVIGIVAIIDFDTGVADYPPENSIVTGVVIGYTDDVRNQVWISLNPKVISGKELPVQLRR